MKILVFSDSHGVKEPMLAAIEEQKPDMVLHLGDYVRDAEAIAAYFPSLDLRYVRGNCDAYSRSDAEEPSLQRRRRAHFYDPRPPLQRKARV